MVDYNKKQDPQVGGSTNPVNRVSTDPLFIGIVQGIIINHGIQRLVPSPVTEAKIKNDILGAKLIAENIRKVLGE